MIERLGEFFNEEDCLEIAEMLNNILLRKCDGNFNMFFGCVISFVSSLFLVKMVESHRDELFEAFIEHFKHVYSLGKLSE